MKNTYEYYYQELPMSKIIAVENEIEKRLPLMMIAVKVLRLSR